VEPVTRLIASECDEEGWSRTPALRSSSEEGVHQCASKEARCVEEFTRGKLKERSEVERGEVEEGSNR
jgi:hypothetical protein